MRDLNLVFWSIINLVYSYGPTSTSYQNHDMSQSLDNKLSQK